MWLSFFCLVACSIVLLILPGFLSVYGVSGSRLFSLMIAPLLSVFLLATISIANSVLGLRATPGLILFELLCVSVAVFVIGSIARSRFCLDPVTPSLPSLGIVVFALAFSFVVSIYNYVIPLDGPSSFAQDSDNSFHLSLIRSFAESGDWSSLGVSVYSGMGENLISPSEGGFYPAAWHALPQMWLISRLCLSCFLSRVCFFSLFCFLIRNGLKLLVWFCRLPSALSLGEHCCRFLVRCIRTL